MSPAGGDSLPFQTTPAAEASHPVLDPLTGDSAPVNPNHLEDAMYELLDQIRQLEIELAQALNRSRDSVALLEEAVQKLKDHRLELEQSEERE
jgi:hypothetical protein